MATTTPNFGWPVPTSTDLVKNGATAIEALGDAIDASLVDLEGGTTGQVLAKASNTDMDFTWTTASSGSAQVAGKNAIINGDFLINQRGFTSNTTSGSYNFDRFNQVNSGGSYTLTPQTFTPGTAPIAGYEGRTYLQAITASQSAAGDFAILIQNIEDVTRYAGSTVTVSFFAKANTGTPKIALELQQFFGTGGSPSTAVNTAGGTVTLSTSWARYSLTVAVPSISGKTLGTTANTSFLGVNLWTSAGSTFNTRASSIGIQNFTASIWGVQLEYGSSATYFTTASNSIAGELALCQRYYERRTYNQVCYPYVGQAFISTAVLIPIIYSEKRGTPTLTLSGTWKQLNASGTGQAATYGFSHQQVTESDLTATTSGMTAGNASLVETTAGTTYIEISAEL